MFERAFSVSDRNDAHHWQLMLAIKSNILQHMDSAPSGVRICCVKFVQQVVLVQTPGIIDPRVRTTSSDMSRSCLIHHRGPTRTIYISPSCPATIR
jgi:hypothetical protein